MENTDFGSKILILNPQNTDFEFSRLACLGILEARKEYTAVALFSAVNVH